MSVSENPRPFSNGLLPWRGVAWRFEGRSACRGALSGAARRAHAVRYGAHQDVSLARNWGVGLFDAAWRMAAPTLRIASRRSVGKQMKT